ncbi:MAG: hypothetical protein ACD_76C00106G0006 [uncultured bacterium]|nr:MAG: hypothetical protein ACD_76C00106G0006 [uncultured bacterium]HBD05593.1 methionyl-tRNA formyltransferase [Candidatus Uhrbacteria bacterium]
MTEKIKTVFFGSPSLAVPFLDEIAKSPGFDLLAAVTMSDKPAGRGSKIAQTPVKKRALELGFPVFHDLKDLEGISADIFCVVAFGKILPDSILSIPKFGTVNMHPSLLPKYRGPSPIMSAIANGEKETGVSIMLLDKKMDHGPLLNQVRLMIDQSETSASLEEKIKSIGPKLLVDSISDYAAGKIIAQAQDDNKATFCKELSRDDGRINWDESAEIIERKIRAYEPWPGSWTIWNRNGTEIRVQMREVSIDDDCICGDRIIGTASVINNKLIVCCKDRAVSIVKIQISGKKPVDASLFINGYADIDKAVFY